MLLFIIVLIVSIAFTVLSLVLYEKCFGFLSAVGAIFAGLGWAAVATMCLVGFMNNAGNQGRIESRQQRYDSLVYQLENNLYDNDNDLGKKELYNEIREWNEDLARGKAMQHDLWFGMFYPDIYDNFKLIELTGDAQ